MRGLLFFLLLPGLQAATRVWEFPALSFGSDRWSVLHLQNPSPEPADLLIEAFRANGKLMPASGKLHLAANETKELRLDPEGDAREYGWARVTATQSGRGVRAQVTASVEVLHDNLIEAYDRSPGDVSSGKQRPRWALPAEAVNHGLIYVANMGAADTEVLVCYQPRVPTGCPDNTPRRYPLKVNASLALTIQAGERGTVVMESRKNARMSLVVLSNGAGERKLFSSESNIQFGDDEPSDH